MYKIASQNAQGRRERIRPKDMPAGMPVLTDEQKRQNLVSRVKQLQAELSETTDKQRRRHLGLMIAEINKEINSIRPAARVPGASQHFIDVAREQLSFVQFQRIMREAVKRAGHEPVGGPI